MDKPLISEILVNTNKLKTREDRIKYLHDQECTALKDVLRIAFDETISLALLEGKNKPSELRFEYPRFRNFVKSASPNLNQFKRETKFVELLESIHPDDAQLFCDAKDKKIKLKYITKATIKAAFPDLIKK